MYPDGNASMVTADRFTLAIPFNVNRIGDVPVSFDRVMVILNCRSFEIVSRSFSYSATELKSFPLEKKSGWVRVLPISLVLELATSILMQRRLITI